MPSKTQAPRATGGRPSVAGVLGRARSLGLLLGLCASLTTLAAAPTAASASGGCAPKLAQVKSFRGDASLDFNATASGEIPGTTGNETVALARQADSLRIALHKMPSKHRLLNFVGAAIHGNVEVEETFADSENGFEGTQTFSGPLTSHEPNSGEAALYLNRSNRTCKYVFELAFNVEATFSGDEEIQPVSFVGGGGTSPKKHIPKSLKMHGLASLPAEQGCTNKYRCYQFGGGWKPDFMTLLQCHSIVAVGCNEKASPGTAEFEWSIWPIYKKHHKKS